MELHTSSINKRIADAITYIFSPENEDQKDDKKITRNVMKIRKNKKTTNYEKQQTTKNNTTKRKKMMGWGWERNYFVIILHFNVKKRII